MMEIWIDVIGFDGTYQCSTEGRIKSVDRFVNSSWKAQIGIKGKKIGLGYFKIEEEAYAAYLKAKPI